MQVVALSKGKYGILRERGDAFELTERGGIKPSEQFSAQWMAKANTPEAREALTEARGDKGSVNPLQIAAEMAEATGRPSQQAEIDAANARIKELEAQVAALSKEPATKDEQKEPAKEPEEEQPTEEVTPKRRRSRRKD